MITTRQKHPDPSIWARDVGSGDAFVDPRDGLLYISVEGAGGGGASNVRCFRLNPPAITFLAEDLPVLRVNLNIEWEIQC